MKPRPKTPPERGWRRRSDLDHGSCFVWTLGAEIILVDQDTGELTRTAPTFPLPQRFPRTMKSILPIQHFRLNPQHAAHPATIAADAIEAAKGGHVVHVDLDGSGDPLVVMPHDALGAVTAAVMERLAVDPEPSPEPATSRRSKKDAS